MKRLLLIAVAVAAALIAAPAFATPEPLDPILGEWHGFYFCQQNDPEPVTLFVAGGQGDQKAQDATPGYIARVTRYPGHADGFTLTGKYERARAPTFLPPSLRDFFEPRGVWYFTPDDDTAPRLVMTASASGLMLFGHPPASKCGPFKHGFFAHRRPPEL